MKRTVWSCDACGADMPGEFRIIAWDLCNNCIQSVREFLRERQSDRLSVRSGSEYTKTED